MAKTVGLAVLCSVILELSACIVRNKASFSVESSVTSDAMLNNMESYLADVGLKLERKTDYAFPEKRKERSYVLGRSLGPTRVHSNYSYVVLRLEETGVLYIDWIFTDSKQVPRPEYFQATNEKIIQDLKEKFGVDVKFNFVESK